MGDDALARGDVRKLNPGGDDAGDFRKREDAVAADDAKESVGEEKPCECGSWLACAGLAIDPRLALFGEAMQGKESI